MRRGEQTWKMALGIFLATIVVVVLFGVFFLAKITLGYDSIQAFIVAVISSIVAAAVGCLVITKLL